MTGALDADIRTGLRASLAKDAALIAARKGAVEDTASIDAPIVDPSVVDDLLLPTSLPSDQPNEDWTRRLEAAPEVTRWFAEHRDSGSQRTATAPSGYPFSAICHLTVELLPLGGTPFIWKQGSGFLVGPSHVLTASDMIPWGSIDPASTGYRIRVVPAMWDGASYPPFDGETLATKVRGFREGSSAAVGARHRAMDLAMIRTQSPIGLAQGVLATGLSTFPTVLPSEAPWFMYGYDSGPPPLRPKFEVTLPPRDAWRIVEGGLVVSFNGANHISYAWSAPVAGDNSSIGSAIFSYQPLDLGTYPQSVRDWVVVAVASGQIAVESNFELVFAGGGSLATYLAHWFVLNYP